MEALVVELDGLPVELIRRVLVGELVVLDGAHITLRQRKDTIIVRPEQLDVVIGQRRGVGAARERADLVAARGVAVVVEKRPLLRGDARDARRGGDESTSTLGEALDEAKVIGNKVARKEEKWTNKGSMKFRVPRPCRYASLFEQRVCANCSAKLPADSNTCSAQIIMVEEQERRRDGRMAGTGKLVARLARPGDSGVRTCGEKLAGCWNHDQHRSCIYVHPDEPQWAAACAGTLDVRADNRLVFCMATDPASQRLAGQRIPTSSRFEALAAAPQRGGGGGSGGGSRVNNKRW
jgi:predicted nucleic acid-binding Zn ribbon protein